MSKMPDLLTETEKNNIISLLGSQDLDNFRLALELGRGNPALLQHQGAIRKIGNLYQYCWSREIGEMCMEFAELVPEVGAWLDTWQKVGQIMLGYGPEKELQPADFVEMAMRFNPQGEMGYDAPLGAVEELESLNLPGLWLIEEIPETILEFVKVRELWISEAEIDVFPEVLGRMTQLEYLRIISCGLDRLGPGILPLQKLRVLGLSSNRFTNVPEEIRQLPLLEELYLPFCDITELPGWLPELPRLRKLNLVRNPLAESRRNSEVMGRLEKRLGEGWVHQINWG
jgi:hypothetical protein